MSKNFINKLQALSSLRQKLPAIYATEAVNFVKERFVLKNWVDGARTSWPERKETKRERGSLLLVSGRLKRSIRKIQVSPDKIIIGSDVPYAKIHNEGGTIERSARVRAHTRRTPRSTHQVKAHIRKMNLTLPQRQFMEPSKNLLRRLEVLTLKEIKKALR